MTGRYSLPPAVDARSAPALQQALLEQRGEDLELVGSAVERLAAPGLQVLLAARRAWREDGARLALIEPSDALAARLVLFGAHALLAA